MEVVLKTVMDIILLSAIIALGAFLLSFIVDAVFVLFDRHKGVYFAGRDVETAKNSKQYDKESEKENTIKSNDRELKKGDITYFRENTDEVIEDENEIDDSEKISEVDMDKAVEEQKAIQENQNVKIAEVSQSEEDFDEILNDVTKLTKSELANAKPVLVKEEVVPITENEEFKALRDELTKLRDELAQKENEANKVEVIEPIQKENNKKDSDSELANLFEKQLEEYKNEIKQKDKQIEELKNNNQDNSKKTLGKVIYKVNERNDRVSEQQSKAELELQQARDAYNKEREELEKLKADWYQREQELFERQKNFASNYYDDERSLKDKATVNSIVKDLSDEKRKNREKDLQIEELKRNQERYTRDREVLEKARKNWEAREDELLKIQRAQKFEDEQTIIDIQRDLERSKREIEDKQLEINKLKQLKEDYSSQNYELENLRRQWKNREDELISIQEKQARDNKIAQENLEKDLKHSKAEIEAKQKEIDTLKKVEKDYSESLKELEKMKENWHDKELALITMQEEQKAEDKAQLEKINKELQVYLNEIEAKEKEITELKKQQEDYSKEIEEIENMKSSWEAKEKELMLVQTQMKENERKEIEKLVAQLDESKEIIELKQKENESKESEIIEKQKKIDELMKINADYSKEKEELENLKNEWKEREEELIDYQEKQDEDRTKLLEKITIELNESKNEIKDKEQEIKDLKKIEADYSEQQKELEKLKADLDEREKELETIQKSQNVTKEEIKNMYVAAEDNSKYVRVARMTVKLAKIMANASKVEKEQTEQKVSKELKRIELSKKQEIDITKKKMQQQLITEKQKLDEIKRKNVEKLRNVKNLQNSINNLNKTVSKRQPIANARATNAATVQYATTRKRVVETVESNSKKNAKISNNDSNDSVGGAKIEYKKPTLILPLLNSITNNKPLHDRYYYEDLLNELNKELDEVSKEILKIDKEYKPIIKIKKSHEKDVVKLRELEAKIAKQKVSLYGVRNNVKLTNEKKDKLDKQIADLEKLKDAVNTSELFLSVNNKRIPDLEKNYVIANKHIERLKNDIFNTKNAIKWYDKNEK